MKKRILAILCVLVLITAMVPLSVSAATTTSSTLIKTNIPTKFTAVKLDPSFTLVNFWSSMTGANGVYVDNIVNWFNSTTGKTKKIYVKGIFQGGYDDIAVKIQATVQAGNSKALPDIALLTPQGSVALRESKYMLYLEDMLNADKTTNLKEKLNKNALAACSYKGKLMGLPFANSALVMHYNADAFKAVGLDPNNPPKTFAEVASAVQKLVIKGTGKKPSRYGMEYTFDSTNLASWITRMGKGTGEYTQFDQEEGRLGMPTKLVCAQNGTLKTVLTEWKKVTDTGAVNIIPSSVTTDFEWGYTAMYFESMVGFANHRDFFKTYPKKAFEYKIARLPNVNANDAGTASHVGGSAMYMLNRGNEKVKAATWEFVKFLASPEVSAYWAINSGYFALNSDSLNTNYMQNYFKQYPNDKIIYTIRNDSLMNTKAQAPMIPNSSVYLNTVKDQSRLYFQGKQTVDTTVSNIEKKASYLLKTWWNANSN